MDNKKSKVMCLMLLNMLDAELSKLVEYELDEDNDNTNHELVTKIIQVLDDVDETVEVLYKDVV